MKCSNIAAKGFIFLLSFEHSESSLVFLSLWLVEGVSQHVGNSFRQQCTMQGQDSWHLLNGENWQRIREAVTEKPGYTLHCVACTVTLQDAYEMGRWWPECLERIQNLFEVLVHTENAQVNLSCTYSISQVSSISYSCITGFIELSGLSFSQLLQRFTTTWNIYLNGMNLSNYL